MAEVTIPKEKMNYTIDLLITMVTDEIAEETGKDRNEVLTDFFLWNCYFSHIFSPFTNFRHSIAASVLKQY